MKIVLQISPTPWYTNTMQQYVPWEKIKALEEEIKALKSLGKKTTAKKKPSKKGHIQNLEGILKEVKIPYKDFQEAKKIWFNEEHLLKLQHKNK